MKRLTRYWFVWAAALCFLGPLIQDCSSAGSINQQFTPPRVAEMRDMIIRNDSGAPGEKEPRNAPGVGDIMIAGGIKGSKSTTQVQFYSFTKKKFIKTGALTTDRAEPCGLTLLVGPGSEELPLFVVGGSRFRLRLKARSL